jgi:hypothetical protein
MSVQTITDTESGTTLGSTGSIRLVPSDYDIFTTHSQSPESSEQAIPDPHEDSGRLEAEQSLMNPSSWPTDHRRVPPYRPINRNLDRSVRPAGHNLALFVFINTMLGGCHILAVVLRDSRLTVGD